MRNTLFLKSLAGLHLTLAFAIVGLGKSDPNRTLSPYFFIKGDPNVDQLPLKDTSVEVNVAGLIADVRVVQTYANEGRSLDSVLGVNGTSDLVHGLR